MTPTNFSGPTRFSPMSSGASNGGGPSIRANSSQLSDRFPVLSFTVDTGGQPHYEVVLATDPSLFHPSRSYERTRSNFYSSRQDSGLIPSHADAYIAPSGVLQRFAGAPSVYYTVLAYDDAGGCRPAASAASGAPSVGLGAGFTGRTLSKVLGVPFEDLRRVRDDGQQEPSWLSDEAGAPESSAQEDAGEGEDGFGLTAALSGQDHERGQDSEESAYAYSKGDPGYDVSAPLAAAYEGGYEAGAGDCRDLSPAAHSLDQGEEDEGESYGLDSTFPPGALVPAELEDQDYGDGGPPVQAGAYDDGFGDEERAGESYGSEESYGTEAYGPEEALSEQKKKDLILAVSENESASFANRYEAVNPRSGPPTGMVFGIVQFTQHSGSLGMLLDAQRKADRAKFEEVYTAAGHALADFLLSRPEKGQPNSRLRPVPPAAGAEAVACWTSPWKERLKRSAAPDLFGKGKPQLFNEVQDQLALHLYLEPMLPMAYWLGLQQDRDLALIVDRSVHQGVGGARKWIMKSILRAGLSDAQVRRLLDALGHAKLEDFQRTIPRLRADGSRGPMTEAALLYHAGRIKGGPPFPVPSPEENRRNLIEAAKAGYAARTDRILGSALLSGTRLTFALEAEEWA